MALPSNTIIGFDAKRVVANATGLGSYGRTLVNDLSALIPDVRLRLYAPAQGRDDLRRQVAGNSNIEFAYPVGRKSRLARDLWRTHGIVADLQRDQVSLYHGLSGELPVGIRGHGIKTVVTIHDLIFMRHPEYYHWIDTKLYTWKFRHTIREADRIIAISECTKRDVMELGHVDASKIDVVYQSCSTRYRQQCSTDVLQNVRKKYNLPERYIINVGTIEERKNILLAVKALPMLPADVALVVVGRQTGYARTVADYAKANGLSSRLLMLSGVPNSDLPAILQMGEAFVYPSRYEGFGIPIIEAIQSGLPVVAATGSCLEEAGGPDSIYVAPDDTPAMADAIKRSLRGAVGREERIARSREYVKKFEGNSVAAQVLQVYGKLLGAKTIKEL